MAVLPTPGSPIRTGLFFVRRLSTWMTRRISSSRPMTGSSLPARAASVRSRPYFCSASYRFSGFWSVTRCDPRIWVNEFITVSRVMPRCVSRRTASVRDAVSNAARSRCSVLTYSSPNARASSSAFWSSVRKLPLSVGCAEYCSFGALSRIDSNALAISAGETPARSMTRGTTPSSWVISA